MIKKILFCLALLLSTVLCYSAPFQNVERILTQPDGTKLYCYASGDEFYNRLHDAKGYTIVQAENGYFVYATTDVSGKIIATQHIAGKSDPTTLGLKPNIMISHKEYLMKREMMKTSPKRNASNLNHGVYNNIVVFIKFKGDGDFKTTPAQIDSMFNYNGYYDISMNNYFKKVTYNQLSMKSYCYPKNDGEKLLAYEDIYPRKYYTPYNETTNPDGYKKEERGPREFALLKRAIEHIADEIPDTLDIDRNDDGYIDNVIFVVKGNVGDWSDLLWPHMWDLHGEDVYIRDKRVMGFNFQLETSTYFTVSTLCHEMAHSLGFPDLYHYNEPFKDLSPTGPWDLMCTNSQPPQHTATYMKYKYGTWIDDIPEIGYGTYTIEANSWEGGRRNCYKIPTSDPDQYYLVEYRNKDNIFEQGLPNGGLLIYRLDTRFNGCVEYNGEDVLDELYIFRPSGSHYDNGHIKNATFCAENDRTEFNHTTDPVPFLNLKKADTIINICNISERGDQMTFSYFPPNSNIIPTNLVANVNKDNYVELKWDTVSNADSYNIYRDGILIANNITDNFYNDEYHNISKGHHYYYVTSSTNDEESFQSNETEVIIGDYCEYIFDMNCSGDNGWQGGEITLSFNNGMKDIFMTMYSGHDSRRHIIVPAGIEMTVSWTAGWDDSECSFTITNEGVEVYKSETLKEGVLATFNTSGEKACAQPKNLYAEASGFSVRLSWNSHVESEYFTIIRNDEVIADNVTSNFYIDNAVNKSGTYSYVVKSKKDNCTSLPSDTAEVTMLTYNRDIIDAEGSFADNSVTLEWTISPNENTNTINYDKGEYITSIGTSSHNWGIMIPSEKLGIYKDAKITAIEIFDACESTYSFSIHNGKTPNTNNLIHKESFTTTNSNEFITFELANDINFDSDKDLWLTAKASGGVPIPCGDFVGLANSNMLKVGSSWKSASEYDMNYSWLIRLHIEMTEDFTNNLSYNIYRQNELIASDLKSTTYIDKDISDGDVCYNVDVIYDDYTIVSSGDICLTVKLDEDDKNDKDEDKSLKVFPNPTDDYLEIKAQGIKNVKIYSILGNIILNEDVNSNIVKIDMRKYGSGLYIVVITAESENSIEKIIVR